MNKHYAFEAEYEIGKRRPSENPDPLIRSLFDYADAKKITSAQIAKRSGYAVRSIHGLRHGERRSSYDMIRNIAQALGGDIVFTLAVVRAPTKDT